MNEILVSYIEDLRDSILVFNEALMELQGGARDKTTVDSVFRVAHTIKGNSAAMNFMKIQVVMHTMEDLLAEVRNGTREITDEMLNILFACHDFLEDCLETVQNDSSDDGIDNAGLLGRLKAIKDGAAAEAPPAPTKPAAAAAANPPPQQAESSVQDVDLAINMPADLWEILYENIRNGGYQAYKLDIRFMKNSSMRAVRAWMIFDRIEQAGIIVHSNPPRLSENSFSAVGETPFESDSIEAMILCEREISELVSDLKETPDVESAEVKRIAQEDIAKKVDFIKQQRQIIYKTHTPYAYCIGCRVVRCSDSVRI